MPALSEKKCLIVLGMHRSGTSSLTGALHLTGFDIGKSIMPPADENPKGFFENTRIVELNDKILEDLFSSWSDTLFIPEGWWGSGLFESHKQRLKDIFTEEFDRDKPVLIKDPRLCIVLPLYLDFFKQEGIEPLFLVCVRNPLEVANSLVRRNNMPREKAFLLWMDYQLQAEHYSRSYPRLFVSYKQFLENPLEVVSCVQTSLGFDLSADDGVQKEIVSFVDPGLTHSTGNEKLPASEPLPELASFYELQVNASLRDLTGVELITVGLLRTRFRAMTRFYNGLPDSYLATLTILFETGEKTVLEAPVKYGTNTLEFNAEQSTPVKGMVLRPCNSRVGISNINAEVVLCDGSVLKLENLRNNAGNKNNAGILVFDTDLPKIMIDFEQPLSISRIDFQMTFLAFGLISNRKTIWRQSKGKS